MSQIASVEYIKKPPHNGSQFTLMLLFISGQMIFLLSLDSEFWKKKLQKEFWKGGEGFIDILGSVLITSLLDDGATTLKAIELTIKLQLKPGSSKYFERKIK